MSFSLTFPPVNTSQRQSTNNKGRQGIMMKRDKKELMMITLRKATDYYLSTLETEGKSPRYIDWLKTRLNYFNRYMQEIYGQDIKLQDLTVEDGREYMRSLMERKKRYSNHPMHTEEDGKLKIQYIHGLGRAVRSFSTWAFEQEYLDENVMHRLKLPKIPNINPEPLSEEEIESVLKASLYDTDERYRNFAILMLFLDCGIRLSELVNLKLSKIDFAIGEMTVFGKGSKERKVPIGTQAKRALMDYVTMQRPNPINPQHEDIVFLNADGFPITQTAVEKIFQRIKKAADIPKFHPHCCRHTFSVRYLMNGGDAFSLQKILGHTTLEMTKRYVNMASGDIKDKHRRFSPMDNLNFQANRRGRPKLKT
jgi:site-specific recombinase XerD